MKNKENILLIWVISVLAFSAWTVNWLECEKSIDSFVMCSGMTFFVWFILIGILNLSISEFGSCIKLRKPKKFKGRKTPIYKILQYNYTYHRIYKYELGYAQVENSFVWGIIPFITLFSEYKYKKVGNVEFYIDDVGTIPDIGEFYEATKAAEKREKEELVKRLQPLEILNKEFKENYI